MAGRPGLYDQLVRFSLLDQGRTVALSDGSDTEKASQLQAVLNKAGSDFAVTPRAVFILRHRVEQENTGSTVEAVTPPPKPEPQNKAEPRPKRKPPPGPNKGSFKPGDPRVAQPGSERATTTGEYRNPLLHPIRRADRQLVEGQRDKDPKDMQRDSVELWDLRLIDMSRRLRRLQSMRKELLTVETGFTRHEGDGEIEGNYREAKRKRQRVDDRIVQMHEAITRTQARRDAAVAKLHAMLKGSDPEDPQAGLKALAAAIEASKQRAANQKAGGAT